MVAPAADAAANFKPAELGRLHQVGLRSLKMTCSLKNHSGQASRGCKCQCWVNLRPEHQVADVRARLEQWLVGGIDATADAHMEEAAKIKQSLGMKIRKRR